MTHNYRNAATAALTGLAIGLMLISPQGSVYAGDVSEKQIIDKLAKPLTRGLIAPAQAREEQSFIEGLRNRNTRSLTLEERGRITAITKSNPNVNLQIYFDFNSAEITAKAEPQLMSLGRALTSPELKDATILVSGHTDASGNESYNKDLSERRADAVKKFLSERFNIPADRLTAIGYGEQQLVNKRRPFSAENRRVQIVNLAATQSAGR